MRTCGAEGSSDGLRTLKIQGEPAKRKKRFGRGITLVELLVVIAIMVILAALLFPVFSQARERGWRTRCISNLKQISQAVLMYARDYDEMLPRDVTQGGQLPAKDPCSPLHPDGRLEVRLGTYIRSHDVYTCSSANTVPVTWDSEHKVYIRAGWGYPAFFCNPDGRSSGRPLSYGWNGRVFQLSLFPPLSGCDVPGVSLALVQSMGNKVMLADASSYIFVDGVGLAFANYPGASAFYARNMRTFWPNYSGDQAIDREIVPDRHTRHQMGQNAAFFDGSARWVSYKAFTNTSYEKTAATWF